MHTVHWNTGCLSGRVHTYQAHKWQAATTLGRYENMPIQIYRKFHLQKLEIFR